MVTKFEAGGIASLVPTSHMVFTRVPIVGGGRGEIWAKGSECPTSPSPPCPLLIEAL